MSDDLSTLRRKMVRLGWQISMTGGNHLRWTGPNGENVISSLTPSGKRAIKRILADLRRAEKRIADPQAAAADPAESRQAVVHRRQRFRDDSVNKG